jgi:hypothetical protein
MQLSSRQRAAIVLRFHEDLSEEQTARVLGCALGTVRSSVARGLRRMRREMKMVNLSESDVREVLDRRAGDVVMAPVAVDVIVRKGPVEASGTPSSRLRDLCRDVVRHFGPRARAITSGALRNAASGRPRRLVQRSRPRF